MLETPLVLDVPIPFISITLLYPYCILYDYVQAMGGGGGEGGVCDFICISWLPVPLVPPTICGPKLVKLVVKLGNHHHHHHAVRL